MIDLVNIISLSPSKLSAKRSCGRIGIPTSSWTCGAVKGARRHSRLCNDKNRPARSRSLLKSHLLSRRAHPLPMTCAPGSMIVTASRELLDMASAMPKSSTLPPLL